MSTDKERDAFWELRTKPLCKFGITSRQQYERLTEAGQERATWLLGQSQSPLGSDKTLQILHREIFRDVYEWAGSFREKEHVLTFGPRLGAHVNEGQFSGAYAPMIHEELKILSKQLKGLLKRDSGPQQTAQAIAFFSTKLHLIHPFRDGNSRVSITLTRFLARRLLPDLKPPIPPVSLYYQVRTLAQQEAFLRPFARHVLGVRLPESLSKSPYSMEVSPHLLTLRLPNNHFASVVCHDAADTRRWQQALSRLRAVGELTSLKDGDTKLCNPLDQAQISIGIAPREPKFVLVHRDVDDREQLLKKKPANNHSVSEPTTGKPRIDDIQHDRRGPRLKF